jgi:aspartyl protease family protein
MRRHLAAMGLALAAAGAGAQTVTLSGSMGDKALLVIDGTPRMVSVGATVQNVKLVSVGANEAVIELGGKRLPLQLGGSPVNLGQGGDGSGTRIVLSAGPGGHFVTSGTINGRSVQFLVDTGATYVSMSQQDAERIGLDYKGARRGMMGTANGNVPVHLVTLNAVRVNDVMVYNVDAVIMPAAMDMVLLGNSFLSRFAMTRENDRLTLERRH